MTNDQVDEHDENDGFVTRPEDRADVIEAIREGLRDVADGRTKPAREALRELAKKYGIPVPPDE